MSEYEASPLSRSDIREIANLFRRSCNLTDTKFFPIVHFLELVMPKLDEQFVWLSVPKSEMGSKHGLAYPDDKLIKIREDVYEGAEQGNGRDRFTIAHEIGHYFLHKKERVSFARRMGAAEKLPAFRDPEWQADAFAGELLAPPHIIKDMSVFEVMRFCGISQQAARKQLKSCG
ncbi:ImmA/IrrE family metallo-endopeptidase [Paenibacillus polymyxa]|uniref:ImmA/IrrE family metallo-endopeptidase n=1 Tax=Paenibacillus polymyxa TaxID=1406 RepID=UPI002ED57C20|nr:ImmA/IrrE family metallo-endopeptidase [Paenibacillus polymyxa]